MRRERLTSLKETDEFQQHTAWEPFKLSKSRPLWRMQTKDSEKESAEKIPEVWNNDLKNH
jgi:hypothetical protein